MNSPFFGGGLNCFFFLVKVEFSSFFVEFPLILGVLNSFYLGVEFLFGG